MEPDVYNEIHDTVTSRMPYSRLVHPMCLVVELVDNTDVAWRADNGPDLKDPKKCVHQYRSAGYHPLPPPSLIPSFPSFLPSLHSLLPSFFPSFLLLPSLPFPSFLLCVFYLFISPLSSHFLTSCPCLPFPFSFPL